MPLVCHPAIAREAAYRVCRHGAPIDLKLDGNEGAPPPAELFRGLDDPELLRRYPDGRALERQIARRLGVEAERVIVTSGADDALDRACRAFLWPGRELVLPAPTFEMLPRYAALTGCTQREVSWPGGPFPRAEVILAIGENTGAVAIVSPNNPTGAVASREDLLQIAEAAKDAALFVDLAYAEFGDDDLTETALALPNAIVFRTLSKAWGLAGLRVGYAIAAPQVVGWLRATGHPYAVGSPSLRLAAAWLERGEPAMRAAVKQTRIERSLLAGALDAHGARPRPSHANFVLCQPRDAAWLRDGLAGLGIAVRIWPGHRQLDGLARITCPTTEQDGIRLRAAVGAVLSPEALLFDMDGVLADVTLSYRRAILETAKSFGADVTQADIAAHKARGDANNDWLVTQALLAERGIEPSIDEIKARFEARYWGQGGRPGLCDNERLLCDRALFERLAARLPLGIVTGRPRKDCEQFLERTDIARFFGAVVCMQDAAHKPSPAPVALALERLGARSAWLVGDTPDDVASARAAGVVPVGFAPGDGAILVAAGAARVLQSLAELETMLP